MIFEDGGRHVVDADNIRNVILDLKQANTPTL